jgi:hypothetical protein
LLTKYPPYTLNSTSKIVRRINRDEKEAEEKKKLSFNLKHLIILGKCWGISEIKYHKSVPILRINHDSDFFSFSLSVIKFMRKVNDGVVINGTVN